MKTSEIKDLTTEEIREKIETEKAALTKMKMNHAVSPLENPMLIRTTRRNIARLMTEMDKSITVAVHFKEKHPIYGKFVNKTKKFTAHDEKNECNIGDTVRIMETRPLSKTKRWRLVEIIERAK